MLLNPACSRGWFSSSALSSLFVSTFVSALWMFVRIFSCFQCFDVYKVVRCLLLSHSSYLIMLLLSPMMLSLVPLLDAMIVSRRISWLYFLMSSLAFFLMVLYISAYSIRCLTTLSRVLTLQNSTNFFNLLTLFRQLFLTHRFVAPT